MNLEEKIQFNIEKLLPNHKFKDVIEYSLYPAGKLFRSRLIEALSEDAGSLCEDTYTYCAAIEAHHTYTLIHDDLPCMDDDDFRRGKLSSHKKFTQADAVLAGDALVNLSYELISNIKNKAQAIKLVSLLSNLAGPRGLILGQVMDLDGQNKNFKDTILLHKLKTSNLIISSLVGANILANEKYDSLQITSLGEHMGIVFQLIDDLMDLCDDISDREKEVNPYVKFDSNIIFKELNTSIEKIFVVLNSNKLKCTKNVIDLYFDKMKKNLNNNQDQILKHIDILDIPLMGFC